MAAQQPGSYFTGEILREDAGLALRRKLEVFRRVITYPYDETRTNIDCKTSIDRLTLVQ